MIIGFKPTNFEVRLLSATLTGNSNKSIVAKSHNGPAVAIDLSLRRTMQGDGSDNIVGADFGRLLAVFYILT
jgi:hypothetical protein